MKFHAQFSWAWQKIYNLKDSLISFHLDYCFLSLMKCHTLQHFIWVFIKGYRAFSPYHQGPNIGLIPNPKYPPFFPISTKKFPKLKIFLPGSEFNWKIAAELLSEQNCNFDICDSNKI